MKELGIIMGAHSVNAILAGRKTQTRRLVKAPNWKPPHTWRFDLAFADPGLGSGGYLHVPHAHPDDATRPVDEWPVERLGSRYQVGQRLWVRETWAVPHAFDGHIPIALPTHGMKVHYAATEERGGLLWRTPLFMPRHLSRITLEVRSIRAERLQAITEADAIAEGIELPTRSNVIRICPCKTQVDDPGPHIAECPWVDPDVDPTESPHVDAYARGWNKINPKHGWMQDTELMLVTSKALHLGVPREFNGKRIHVIHLIGSAF